jgi:hypothetical protein
VHGDDQPHLFLDILDAEVLAGEHGAPADLPGGESDSPARGNRCIGHLEILKAVWSSHLYAITAALAD